jgi:hypothetical protein
MKSYLAVMIVVSLCGTFVACLDFTPIDSLPPKPNGGAPLDDGAPNDGAMDVDSGNRCLACAGDDDDGGGCHTTFAACQALPACQSTILCVAAGCLAPGADITGCLAGCEADAGTSTPGTPATVALGALLQCMIAKCQASCL